MKTLIVYYSFTQNNDVLAKNIQRKLGCDIHRIEEKKRRTGFTILLDIIFNRTPEIVEYYHPINLYEHYIFIGPVWAGKIASPLRAFLSEEKDVIKRYSFITVCGGNAGQAEKIKKELVKIVGHAPDVLTELWVNDLLPDDRKNTIKYTSGYRLTEMDLETFRPKIDKFLESIPRKGAQNISKNVVLTSA